MKNCFYCVVLIYFQVTLTYEHAKNVTSIKSLCVYVCVIIIDLKA